MSLEETQARHRKEFKSLDGEKRAKMKKMKATAGKGKKVKEVLAEVESGFATKLKELEVKHANELAEILGSSNDCRAGFANTEGLAANILAEEATVEDERKLKQAKARRKREKMKEKDREREMKIEREKMEAGPSARQIEMDIIQQQIEPLGMTICEIPSDGNCLYRAVADHCGSTYQETRNLCADTLLKNESEFAPFCEYDDNNVPDFIHYVERVRNSSDWGGHLELRVLSLALQKHIFVYSAQTKEPLHIKPQQASCDDYGDEPIHLSYHLHYYALGEHYNQVVRVADGE